MTLLYYDPIFLEHQTGRHPERAERLLHTMRELERRDLLAQCHRPTWQAASESQMATVHSASYLTDLADFCASGGGRIEEDTVCSAQSFKAATLAAGAACHAVSQVVAGAEKRALCLVRPPGHHALADAPMGFCLLGNVAIAARSALRELEIDRVLIVDWDVHHGNGTQAMFWEDQQVGFLSIHRWPFYPGTGDEDETGSGAALGTKVNLPTEFGTPRSEFIKRFQAGLERLADRMRPQLVIISAGFDAHRDDPVGSLGLETEDFATLTDGVLEVADAHAGGRVVSVLEGGYNTSILAGCVALHLERLLARDAK